MPRYGETPRLTYSEYLRVEALLQQQRCLAEPPQHDELQFIIVHQVYELWFKLVLHELDGVRAALDDGDDIALRLALRLLGRVGAILDVLVQQIHVLETMRPADFLRFRSHLRPASGFQSVQFRELECLMGLKDARLVGFTRDDPRHEAVVSRLDGPTLPGSLYALLRRRGLAVTEPAERSAAEGADTLAALKQLYQRPDDHPLVYELCEALLDIDEKLVLWRRHHVMMVERQIGFKPGTGAGTAGELDGLRYLRTTLDRQALPDLWAVRTELDD